MVVAFLESIKYVGHQYPVAFLRLFTGYYFLNESLDKINGEYLTQPMLAAAVTDWLPHSGASDWYVYIMEMVVVPHWQIFAYLIAYCQFLIGVSFLLGFMVRPMSIVGALLVLNFIYAGDIQHLELHKVFLALFIVLAWIGAGRCLGLDYFFYKRQRGIWW